MYLKYINLSLDSDVIVAASNKILADLIFQDVLNYAENLLSWDVK